MELLSPAGDYECLEAAVLYGANAVYIGGKQFGMRASPQNFDDETLIKAVAFAHSHGTKVYLTCNTMPTNDEIEMFPDFIRNAAAAHIDAVIVCDLGVLAAVKQYAPELAIHMSTQTGVVNYATANELYKMGVKRIVLAREVSIEEIKKIREKIPQDMEIEAFVHGAMCVSFSGRCLLSTYLTNRNANRGECAQPCRWKYYLMEENRPGQYFKIEEDDKGSYILNAKDLCMISHIKELSEAGVNSFKIEGRAKSSYYVAIITNAYKAAIKAVEMQTEIPKWAIEEVYKVSHRNYCTGFYLGHQDACQYYEDSGYIREYDFIGTVNCCNNGFVEITQRNYFSINDEIEVLSPNKMPVKLKAGKMFNSKNEEIEIANHAMEIIKIECDDYFAPSSVIRKLCTKKQ